MGDGKVVVYGVVGVLSVAAAVLAFAGEGTKVGKGDIMQTSSRCIYPRSPANALGYTAVVLLLIAQITISVVTRCACCNRNTCNPQSTVAILCFIISWVASAIGILLLLSAANITTSQQKAHISNIDFCFWVKPGIFIAGGALGIVACALGLYAYRSSTKHAVQPAPATTPGAAPYHYQGGIAMGQPQLNNSAFLHSSYLTPSNNNNSIVEPSGQLQEGGDL